MIANTQDVKKKNVIINNWYKYNKCDPQFTLNFEIKILQTPQKIFEKSNKHLIQIAIQTVSL